MLAIVQRRRWLLVSLSLTAVISAIGLGGNFDLSLDPSLWFAFGFFVSGLLAVAAAATSPRQEANRRDRRSLLVIGVGVMFVGMGLLLASSSYSRSPFRVGWVLGGLGSVTLTVTLFWLAKDQRGRATQPAEHAIAQASVVAAGSGLISLVFWVLNVAWGQGWLASWSWASGTWATSIGLLAAACFVAAKARSTWSLRLLAGGLLLLTIGSAIFAAGYGFASSSERQWQHFVTRGLWVMAIGCVSLAIAPLCAAAQVRKSLVPWHGGSPLKTAKL